jgi:hypothetical protein
VRESWVSALLQYCTLCQFIRMTARWFSVGILYLKKKKKSIYFGGGSIFIHIDARRYSSRGKRFTNDLFRGRFNFCRMKYIFYFFFFSFRHVLGHFGLYSRNDRKCV